jgi:hypothetical protein
MSGSVDEFRTVVRKDHEKFQQVVRKANIKAE